MKIHGEKYGIDLQKPDVLLKSVKYLVGDILNTGLPDNYFQNITCLSVIEHDIDFKKFSSEASRLLKVGGKLFITFDYWNPKILSPIEMYGKKWQPLDKQSTEEFISEIEKNNLYLLEDMDWSLKEAVIKWGYYSPHPSMKYTFGLMVFEKR